MKIEIVKTVENGYGRFAPGAVVDWPERDALPLIQSGWAVEYEPPAPPLAGVDFASDEAAEKAIRLGLDTEDFDGLKASGMYGYTSRDVDRALRGADEEE